MKVLSALAALAAGVTCNKAVLVWDSRTVDTEADNLPLLVDTLENSGYTVYSASCDTFSFEDQFGICVGPDDVQAQIDDAALVVVASNFYYRISQDTAMDAWLMNALADYVTDGGTVVTFAGTLVGIHDEFNNNVADTANGGEFINMLPALFSAQTDSYSSDDLDNEFDIYKVKGLGKQSKKYLKGIKEKMDLFPETAHWHPADMHIHSRIPGSKTGAVGGYDVYDLLLEPTSGSEVMLDSIRFGAYFSQKTTGKGSVFVINSNLADGGGHVVHQLVHNIAVDKATTKASKSQKKAFTTAQKSEKKAHKRRIKSAKKGQKKLLKTIKLNKQARNADSGF